MDKSTHDVRARQWTQIIEQCQSRPVYQTAKQWLQENGIKPSVYYYWQRKKSSRAGGEADLKDLHQELHDHYIPKEDLDRMYGKGCWRELPAEEYKCLRYEPATWTAEVHNIRLMCMLGLMETTRMNSSGENV